MYPSPRTVEMEELQQRSISQRAAIDGIGVQVVAGAANGTTTAQRTQRTFFGLIGTSQQQQQRENEQEREYVIPNYDFHFTADNIDGLMLELQDRAHRLAIRADRHAKIIKGFLITSQVLLILMGIAITVLSLNQCTFGSTSTKYIVGVLGALVTGIEGVRSTFELNKRGNLYRLVYNKALEVTRKARMLKLSHISAEQLEIKLNNYYERLCELDISFYSLRVIKFTREDRQSQASPLSAEWPRNRASPEPASEVIPPDLHAGLQRNTAMVN